jgi:hypothetical protein
MLYLKGEKVCTCGFAEILIPQNCDFAEIYGLPIWLLYRLFYVKTLVSLLGHIHWVL